VTIAVCCVTPEGVIFGADSTSSLMVPGGFHYLNHNQKVFEIGDGSTVGAVTWGMASLGLLSHRTQLAQLADYVAEQRISGVSAICDIWIERFWPEYQIAIARQMPDLLALHAKSPHGPTTGAVSSARTQQEEQTYQQLRMGLFVGFCIGGHDPSDRLPCAFEIKFDPLTSKPTPSRIVLGDTRCWGVPKVFGRIVKGIDPEVTQAIVASGKWTGSVADLEGLLSPHQLYLPGLPMRDAIDFVHSCISSTIKTLKFSHLSQTCGGPIEIAVITTDRDFRWVRHKEWDAAIKEGYASWKF